MSLSKNPTEILEQQLELLQKIYEAQIQQNHNNGNANNNSTEKWEYHAEFISADMTIEQAKKFISEKIPGWKSPPRYSPVALLPRLNSLGENGWEVIHIEPIPHRGNNDDIGFPVTGVMSMAGYIYSHTYFCAFKRKIP